MRACRKRPLEKTECDSVDHRSCEDAIRDHSHGCQQCDRNAGTPFNLHKQINFPLGMSMVNYHRSRKHMTEETEGCD